MKRILITVLVASAFLVLLPKALQAQSPNKPNAPVVNPLVLYDDFNGRWIDPTKWSDSMGSVNLLEIVRELSPSYQGEGNNRRLHLFERAYGLIGTEGLDYGAEGLWFRRSIKEVAFQVVVNKASTSGCQENPDTFAAHAEFGGSFFNYGGVDVSATLSLIREGNDAQAPLKVQALYVAEDWSIWDYQILGYVPLGQTAKLRLKWDQANHQFIFQLNRDPEVILAYGSAIPDDTTPPNFQNAGIGIWQGTPRCPSTTPGGAVMDAYFDNVYVNAP
jgi:hypothetical protein